MGGAWLHKRRKSTVREVNKSLQGGPGARTCDVSHHPVSGAHLPFGPHSLDARRRPTLSHHIASSFAALLADSRPIVAVAPLRRACLGELGGRAAGSRESGRAARGAGGRV